MNDASASNPVNEHNHKAAAMWGGPGRAYDEISRGIASAIEHCVERLAPAPGERILDVATGTGYTARRAAAWGAEVTGVDISEGMLTGARALAAEARLDIDYHLGDAENLPFADNSFDGVISTFGVMFAPDQEAAIAELARVCKPGGRLAVAAWTAASTAVAMRQQMIPFMPTPPADAPVPPSPFNWADPDWLQTTLGADFDVACETGTTFTRYASAEAWWQLYTNSFGPTKGVADGLDEAPRAELTAVMTEWMDGYKTDLGVALPIDYLVTLGRRKT